MRVQDHQRSAAHGVRTAVSGFYIALPVSTLYALSRRFWFSRSLAQPITRRRSNISHDAGLISHTQTISNIQEPLSLYSYHHGRKLTGRQHHPLKQNVSLDSPLTPPLSFCKVSPNNGAPLNAPGALFALTGPKSKTPRGIKRAARVDSFLPAIGLRCRALSEVSARMKGRNVLVRSKPVVGYWGTVPTRRRVRQRRTEGR